MFKETTARAALLAALLCLPLCGPAGAQSKLVPPPLDSYLRWGALRVRPGIDLTDVGYDDNILANNDERVGDYMATVSPKLEALLLLGDTAFLQLDAGLDFVFYLENTDQDYDNTHGGARFTFPARRIGFFADVAYDRTNLRPVDLQSVRVQRTDENVGGGVILTPNWRTEIELRLGYSALTYDEPGIAFRQDRDEDSARVDASYRVFGFSRSEK